MEAEDSEGLGLRRTLPEDKDSFIIEFPGHVQRGRHLPAQSLQLDDDVSDDE